MTWSTHHWVILVIVSLSMLTNDEEYRRRRLAGPKINLRSELLFAGAVLIVALLLEYWNHPIWASIAWVLGLGKIVDELSIASNGFRNAIRHAWVWYLVAGVSALFVAKDGLSYYQGQERARMATQQMAQREIQVAAELGSARRTWQAGEGVAEVRSGPVFSWIAIQPTIDIDWEYERANPSEASREIPIRVAWLNDSFADADLRPDAPPWRLYILNTEGESLIDWTGKDFYSFAPAERRELNVPWDGKDRYGALLPPGTYTVRLDSPPPASESANMQSTLGFVIDDKGPVITVIPDASEEIAHQQAVINNISKTIDQGLMLMQQQRQMDSLINSILKPIR